ncbi:MAG: sugar ABC transporter substrate-binding protein [Planctomycetota bacterium]|nr:sugar ABC transporter substrate-binding protein [Planctomycetota bacterium]
MKVVVWLLISLVLLGIVYSFSTCQSEKTQGRIVVTIFDWPFAIQIQLDNELIKTFEAKNPDIKGLLVTGNEQKYMTMVTAGVAPDVAGTGYGYIHYYAERGTILPLNDLIEADEKKRNAIVSLDKIADPAARRKAILALDESIADAGAKDRAIAEMDKTIADGKTFNCAEYFNARHYYSRDDYFPATLEAVTYKGKVYALPSTGSPVALIYNKDMFDRYNREHPDGPKLQYPSAKWTWDDYRKAAVALTQDRDNNGRIDVYGASMGFHRNRFPMFVWQSGGEVISTDKNRCLMDSPEAIRGIQFMYDMLWKYKCAPTAQTQIEGATEQDESVRFKEQRIAMLLTTRYSYSKLLKEGKIITDFEWDIAPLPKNPDTGSRTSIYIGGGWMISAGTRNRKEAWRMAKFLVGDKASELTMQAGRAIVANIAVAERMTKGPNHKPDHDHLWIDIMNDCRPKDFEYRVGVAGPMFDKAMGEIYELPYDRRKPKEACINCANFFNQGLKALREKQERDRKEREERQKKKGSGQ